MKRYIICNFQNNTTLTNLMNIVHYIAYSKDVNHLFYSCNKLFLIETIITNMYTHTHTLTHKHAH